ncbi:helix-turn-helix domain-containing protein [Mucilaginibacter sp. UR6-1]|uniref:helix-turn-helix domain-containing protein n=1 Tax=Mucilaginibacter sp. UR6-1 TaxID=1435643 RepID=UPI001E3DEBCA|nr:helix-turn-helix domain-containing protein [Mucilaginibacter sp. UR6-1]MCC8407837.1 helix-turn-helix domain-containing protein [Mucilaginibacter sp. UR6-1]
MSRDTPYAINSISEHRRVLSLPGPEHPLIDIFRMEDLKHNPDKRFRTLMLNVYCISLKKKVSGKVKYGQGYYDYDEGLMSFFAPGQIVATVPENHQLEGWCVAFHPDFLKGFPLARKIESYNFFSYAINEALFLSEKEETVINNIVDNIRLELETAIDGLTQEVMIAQLELLLHYSQRFYLRQFNTRKPAHHQLLTEVENLLNTYFNNDELLLSNGLPTISYLSERLNKSPKYLSDLLRNLSGRSAQQHIQDHLLEKAKVLLTGTDLTVAEIAYRLGFDYPQSFNKLFRRKTNQTPLVYRQSFN